MKMRMQTFGEIEFDGERYDYDLVIEQGGIRKTAPRRPAPVRRPAPEPEVGPFGF